MASDTGISSEGAIRLSPAEAQELDIVTRMAANVVGARPDEIDDLGQNVALKLLAKWSEPHVRTARLRGGASWRGYVVQSARHALVDMRRKSGRAADRERRVTNGFDGDPLPDRPAVLRSLPAPASDVDAYLARVAVVDSLDDAGLTDQQREVMTLDLLQGLSAKEIAIELGLSARWVRELRQGGKSRLQSHIRQAE